MNAAHRYRYITIDVIEINLNQVVYKIHGYPGFDQKPYQAENLEGQLTLRLLEEGKSYVIEQKVGKRDRTTWVDAKPLHTAMTTQEMNKNTKGLLVF